MWSRKHENYELYWSNSSLEKLVIVGVSTPVLRKIKTSKSKIWFSSIVQLFWCEFDLVRLPNSIEWVRFSSIEFDWNTVRLGSIDSAGNNSTRCVTEVPCQVWVEFLISTRLVDLKTLILWFMKIMKIENNENNLTRCHYAVKNVHIIIHYNTIIPSIHQ